MLSKQSLSKNQEYTLFPETRRVFREVEAAAYIGMSRSFLKKGRYSGPVDGQIPPPPFILIGKRTVRYLKEDLDHWLTQFPKMLSTHLEPLDEEGTYHG